MTSQSEILVRLLLWLWVVINLAIVVTLLVNAGFQQAFPGYQFKARMVVLLREVATLLARPDASSAPTFKEIARQFAELQSLYQQATRSSPEIADSPQAWQSLMAATLHCYHLAALLQPEEAPSAGRLQLAAALSTLAQNLDVSTLPAILPEATARDTANPLFCRRWRLR
jgi:multidrug resistance protein MdtO